MYFHHTKDTYHLSELAGCIGQSLNVTCLFCQTERAVCVLTGHPSRAGLFWLEEVLSSAELRAVFVDWLI